MSNNYVVECSLAEHGEQILDIFNEAIANSTALYDYKPRTSASMQGWFEGKAAAGYPVIGLVSDSGSLLGFSTFGAFRPQPAYKYTVEHSVYVRKDQRGNGFGKHLLELIVAAAIERDLHAVVGVIDAKNAASIKLHEQLGFALVGKMPQIGFKFGEWLDVLIYQRTLLTPANPTDG